ALLANLDLTHGLGWRLLAGLFEPQVQTWAIWASGAVLWLAALRTVANYTGMGGMRWLDIGCTAASLALFAGMLPGSGVLPPSTAPGLAFAVLAAMLAAAAVGALRGQRGGSWALVAWGPLLLVLMVEIATGVISGWRVEAMLAGASVQVFVLGAALFAPVGQ